MAGRSLLNFAAGVWNRLGLPVRRRLAWLTHDKFIHGVSAVILDEEGRVLLLKHRFWKGQRWGLPGGLARRGETLEATLRRELLEETGMEVRPRRLLKVNAARGLLTEFVLLADCTGTPATRSAEIMEARFWDRRQLPENMTAAHRELLEGEWEGMALEE